MVFEQIFLGADGTPPIEPQCRGKKRRKQLWIFQIQFKKTAHFFIHF